MCSCIKASSSLVSLVSSLHAHLAHSSFFLPILLTIRVEPILYSRIIVYNANILWLLYRTICDPASSKTPRYLASHVKTIIFTFCKRAEQAVSILLNCCQSAHTIVVWGESTPPWQLDDFDSPVKACNNLAPKHLSIYLQHTPRDEFFAHPIFKNVTHLELFGVYYECWLSWRWDTLSHLKSLTHISLHMDFYQPGQLAKLVKQAAASCSPGLRVILVWFHHSFSGWINAEREFSDIMAIHSGDVDLRAVVAYRGPTKGSTGFVELGMINRENRDMLCEWSGQYTREDFWTQAEDQIEERRRQLETATDS